MYLIPLACTGTFYLFKKLSFFSLFPRTFTDLFLFNNRSKLKSIRLLQRGRQGVDPFSIWVDRNIKKRLKEIYCGYTIHIYPLPSFFDCDLLLLNANSRIYANLFYMLIVINFLNNQKRRKKGKLIEIKW